MIATITGNADAFADSLPFDEFIERLGDVANTETDRGIVRRAIRLLRRYENEQRSRRDTACGKEKEKET